jgi:Uma2 family endonuclease
MLKYNPLHCLPSSEELPESGNTPVDNELQDLIPGLLKAILVLIWSQRWHWFFGVDMGIYHDSNKPAIVPDGFLSIGLHRFIDEGLRPSYVLWEENKLPILVLEVFSQPYPGEYSTRKDLYAHDLGILYYVVYNPQRRRQELLEVYKLVHKDLYAHDLGILYYVIYNTQRKRQELLEVYKLVNGEYVLISGNPVWLPEIGLGIGREIGTYQGITRERLSWFDEEGKRFFRPEERIQESE